MNASGLAPARPEQIATGDETSGETKRPVDIEGDLFEKQPACEKHRLLNFVLSNSFWANGELTPEFRQPFDMLADMATVGAQKMAAGLLTSSHHQKELPATDLPRDDSLSRGLREMIVLEAFGKAGSSGNAILWFS